jgi:ribosome-associated protein
MKINIPLNELNFSFSRSSGKGGQNVNKVNSKVSLRFNISKTKVLNITDKERFRLLYKRKLNEEGEILITSQRFRDQGRNVADCMEKLEVMLLESKKRVKKRVKTKPTKASKERRIQDKKRVGGNKKLRQEKF